jgi:hypothetical protein
MLRATPGRRRMSWPAGTRAGGADASASRHRDARAFRFPRRATARTGERWVTSPRRGLTRGCARPGFAWPMRR